MKRRHLHVFQATSVVRHSFPSPLHLFSLAHTRGVRWLMTIADCAGVGPSTCPTAYLDPHPDLVISWAERDEARPDGRFGSVRLRGCANTKVQG